MFAQAKRTKEIHLAEGRGICLYKVYLCLFPLFFTPSGFALLM